WNQVGNQVYPIQPQGTFAKTPPVLYTYNYGIRPNAAQANAYARRLIAAYFQGPECYVEAASPAGESGETFECSVCMEDVPLDSARKPAACAHAADICVDCVKQTVESQTHLKCPSADCETVLTPNDILTFGMGGEQADAWALKLVKAMSRGERDWETCATPDCVGGIRVPRGEQFAWTCVCCSQTQATSNYIVDLATDKGKILSLIDDLRGGNMNGKKRECYHCGFICEHINGCEAMTCGGRYKPWSFNRGLSHAHGNIGQAQTF